MRHHEISNSDDLIDSRDVIARIEELQDERDSIEAEDGDISELEAWDEENKEELDALLKLQDEASASPDWHHGETLIREDYFTDYIEELINDCYDMPKEMNSGAWPWRHIAIDYEAAAEEAKQDYIEVDFDGATYLIRA